MLDPNIPKNKLKELIIDLSKQRSQGHVCSPSSDVALIKCAYNSAFFVSPGGKSAIMAGIMVGLGGRACCTERGRSLKQFIRSGTNSSSVKVILRNRGPNAYRHDAYGDAIVVERVINKDGSGSYKIKSKGMYIW